jgi:type IV secretory pathway TraG/TraD family ATPase VirD4
MTTNPWKKSNRFTTIEDVKNYGKYVKFDDVESQFGGPVLFVDNDGVYVDDTTSHSLAQGSTDSTKTVRYVFSLILSTAKRGDSMIIVDPKGELYQKFYPYLKSKDYDIFNINFREPGKGSRWNPLDLAFKHYQDGNIDRSDECIREFARSMYSNLAKRTTDAFWSNSSEDYFTGLAQVVRDWANPDMLTVENVRFLNSMGFSREKNDYLIKNLYNNLDRNSETSLNLAGTVEAPNDTRESIRSVFSQPNSLYGGSALRDMMCQSDFDLDHFGDCKSVLFIIAPDEKTQFNPIIAALIKQCYSRLIEIASTKYKNLKLPKRVNFIIDEFSSLPAIDDFDSMISASRSRNIRFHLVIQGMSQLQDKYSEATTKNILNNCRLWYVFPSNDLLFHQYLSQLAGETTDYYNGYSKKLITSSMIQNLDKDMGEVLVHILGKGFYFETFPYFDELPIKLPQQEETVFMPRIPIDRNIISVHDMIKKSKDANALKNNTESGISKSEENFDEDTSYIQFDPKEVEFMNDKLAGLRGETQVSFNLVELEKRIDQRIAELEAEELRAKEAKKTVKEKEETDI